MRCIHCTRAARATPEACLPRPVIYSLVFVAASSRNPKDPQPSHSLTPYDDDADVEQLQCARKARLRVSSLTGAFVMLLTCRAGDVIYRSHNQNLQRPRRQDPHGRRKVNNAGKKPLTFALTLWATGAFPKKCETTEKVMPSLLLLIHFPFISMRLSLRSTERISPSSAILFIVSNLENTDGDTSTCLCAGMCELQSYVTYRGSRKQA